MQTRARKRRIEHAREQRARHNWTTQQAEGLFGRVPVALVCQIASFLTLTEHARCRGVSGSFARWLDHSESVCPRVEIRERGALGGVQWTYFAKYAGHATRELVVHDTGRWFALQGFIATTRQLVATVCRRTPQLRRLQIHLCRDDSVLAQLATGLPQLRTLHLTCTSSFGPVVARQLAALAAFGDQQQLESLTLNGFDPRRPEDKASAMSALLHLISKGWSHLTHLDVQHWPVDDDLIQRVVQHMPRLQHLNLNGLFGHAFAGLTNAGLQALGRLPTLTRLHLAPLVALTPGTYGGDFDDRGICELQSLSRLTALDLPASRFVRGTCLEALSVLPLTELRVTGSHTFDLSQLQWLKRMPLKTLHLNVPLAHAEARLLHDEEVQASYKHIRVLLEAPDPHDRPCPEHHIALDHLVFARYTEPRIRKQLGRLLVATLVTRRVEVRMYGDQVLTILHPIWSA